MSALRGKSKSSPTSVLRKVCPPSREVPTTTASWSVGWSQAAVAQTEDSYATCSVPSAVTTGLEPWLNGVIPPVKPTSDGEMRAASPHVRPPSTERLDMIGDSWYAPAALKVNRVHVTYAVPRIGSTPIHSLSLKNVVGTWLPSAATPSSWTIDGSAQVSPPSWDTETTRPEAPWSPAGTVARLNTRLA